MDGLREEQDSNGNANTRSCKFLEVLAVGFGGFLLFVLVFLHLSFVGSPGCLRDELMRSVGSLNSDGTLLRSDQILYINVDARYRPEKSLDVDDRGEVETASAVTMLSWRPLYDKADSWFSFAPDGKRMRGFDQATPFIINRPHNYGNESTYTGADKANTTNYTEPEYDYKFTFNSGLLLLSYEELMQHGFSTVNVSLLGSQCYGNAFSQSIIPIGGVDTVVVNALMYTFRESGHVFTGAGDYFRWSESDIVPYRTAGEWLQFKLLILLYSVMAFFLLTTVTALMVRILISSGVVLIFPVFWLLQWAGFAPLNLRVVAISYPWIGVPLEMIRGRNQSTMPFLIGHMSRVVIYYFLYQATQLVFAVWFYNRDSPGNVTEDPLCSLISYYLVLNVALILTTWLVCVYLCNVRRPAGAVDLRRHDGVGILRDDLRARQGIYRALPPRRARPLPHVPPVLLLLPGGVPRVGAGHYVFLPRRRHGKEHRPVTTGSLHWDHSPFRRCIPDAVQVHCIRVYELKDYERGYINLDQPR